MEAVSKAITAGRLRESVVEIGGAPKIADPELADREWDANTRPRVDHPPPPQRNAAPVAAGDDPEALPAGIPAYNVSRAVREHHAARREAALADAAEIERDEKRETLIPLQEARDYITGKFSIVKQKFLAIPSRVAQRFPEFTADSVTALEEFLHEILKELAADEDGGDDGDEESAE